jgi:agmatine deiminase
MTQVRGTPRKRGYFFPAEWEPHEGTWIGWPHNRNDWPGKLGAVRWVYGEIARHLTAGEVLNVLAPTKDIERQARRVFLDAGATLERVRFFRIPTNRSWTRDSGPLFLKHPSGSVAVAHFRFDAWAKYSDYAKDAKVPRRVAERLSMPVFTTTFSLEGGAFDTNGNGAVMTTEECMLDRVTQARNPTLNRRQIERTLHDYLGTSEVIWLGRGIKGDDTHGHVDDFCRFANTATLVLCEAKNAADPNYEALEENRERLEATRFEVVRLPMPSPLFFKGRQLPASYANFYIGNASVLVPTFNDPQDRVALGILSELFPDRTVVGIHAVDLVWGLGALHCLTQQQPAVTSSAVSPQTSESSVVA